MTSSCLETTGLLEHSLGSKNSDWYFLIHLSSHLNLLFNSMLILYIGSMTNVNLMKALPYTKNQSSLTLTKFILTWFPLAEAAYLSKWQRSTGKKIRADLTDIHWLLHTRNHAECFQTYYLTSFTTILPSRYFVESVLHTDWLTLDYFIITSSINTSELISKKW